MVPAGRAHALVRTRRVAVGPFFGRQILLYFGCLLHRRSLSDALAALAYVQDLPDGIRLQGFVNPKGLPVLRLLERVLASYYDPC